MGAAYLAENLGEDEPLEDLEEQAPDADETEVIEPPAEPVPPASEKPDASRPKSKAEQRAAQQQQETEAVESSRLQELRAEAQAERDRASRLENAMQERTFNEGVQRLEFLQAELVRDDIDANTRRQLLAEHTHLATQTYLVELNRWETWKADEIERRGLNPGDRRFRKTYSAGEAGLAEFQRDLVEAENESLRTKLAAAEKGTMTPEKIEALVRKQVAKLARAQGLDQVDLGEPERSSGTDDTDAWERDLDRFQTGRMSPADYTKKWGGRR